MMALWDWDGDNIAWLGASSSSSDSLVEPPKKMRRTSSWTTEWCSMSMLQKRFLLARFEQLCRSYGLKQVDDCVIAMNSLYIAKQIAPDSAFVIDFEIEKINSIHCNFEKILEYREELRGIGREKEREKSNK